METIIVQPLGLARAGAGGVGVAGLLKMAPGDVAEFGRGLPGGEGVSIVLPDPGISRRAGLLEAAEDHWRLSNYSAGTAYLVENLEGAGEYISVGPGRLAAPVPFEFSRVVLPGVRGTAGFKVFAPRHAYRGEEPAPRAGERTLHPYPLDTAAKYFLVLVALCEPRLRDPSDSTLPGAGDIVGRLRPLPDCHDLTRSAVNYHIDYLATRKLRLDPADTPDTDTPRRIGAKRAALVSVALRFRLVREEHLALLPSRRRGTLPTAT
ncbi:serine/threonine protein kinase [Streptomyces sp. NPDC004539]|uniref:serine/threonine protein kinase n=1 Tax=Streptomyces sp. NPDC004539 TaxID=3154280 RepID=UPI0033BD6125